MSTTPSFAAADVITMAAIAATANTNQDGTGTLATLFTGNAGYEQRINAIVINGVGTTTAGKLRFYLSTDGGVTKRKIGEMNVTAATPSATVATFQDTFYPPVPIPIKDANCIIYAAPYNAEAFVAATIGVRFG